MDYGDLMKYFLGVDVGSSKTHALISDEAGRCAGFGKAGGGNYQGVGYDGLKRALTEAFVAARQMAGVDAAQIAGAGFGIAGYDFPSDRTPHLQAIAALGLACPVEVVNDGLNGLLAGATDGIGVNVTAGSSNNCRGRNRQGLEGRIVGNGAMFGEYGGAIEIVYKALQMANYAWIKRIPPTALTDILLKATGAPNEIALMEYLSSERRRLSPSMAVQVIAAAKAGDAAAGEIIQWAGEELGWLAVSVARQLGMDQTVVEVIQSGSIFDAGEILMRPMHDLVLRHCPQAKIIRLQGPPVVGTVILGMEQAGVDGFAVRDELTRGAKEIVQ
jgi:N-acetylglucosamine kinase-like BadF-type ATPase